MYFCLIIAILSTLLYINIIITDIINSRINPYLTSSKELDSEMNKTKLKISLILIMALFWATVIYFLIV